MSRKSKKIIFYTVIAIAFVGFAVGYSIWNKPHKDVKNAKAVSITSVDLYNKYLTDSASSITLYENKVLVVSGEIARISINQQNQQVILLKTNTEGGSVNCTMEQNISNPRLGSMISLKGICIGYINGDTDMGLPGEVFMIRCYLLNQ